MGGWSWPQWVLAALIVLEFLLAAKFNGRVRPNPSISVWTKSFDLAVIVALTWAGGFWS